MASELKPCPFCNRTKHLIVDDYHDSDMEGYFGFTIICNAAGWEGADKGCGASGAWGETKEEAINIWNTRAAPDVPELVTVERRYMGKHHNPPFIHLVRKDQASEVIQIYKNLSVLQSETIELLEKDVMEERQRSVAERQSAEAAEAKLAEYEKQEPIGVIHQGVFYSTKDLEEYPEYSTGIKIYVSPAPMEEE